MGVSEEHFIDTLKKANAEGIYSALVGEKNIQLGRLIL